MGAITENEWRYNQLIKQFPSEAEPPFEDAGLLERWWGRNWGCTTDVGRLRVVLMHRPGEEVNIVDTSKRLDSNAFGDEQTGWYWRGTEAPDLAAHAGAARRATPPRCAPRASRSSTSTRPAPAGRSPATRATA